MNISQEEYISLLEGSRKHNKVLGQIEALENAIELMVRRAHEWEMAGDKDREFIASQTLIREVVELKGVVAQSHFKN